MSDACPEHLANIGINFGDLARRVRFENRRKRFLFFAPFRPKYILSATTSLMLSIDRAIPSA
jgi:hypothetical protein